MNLMCWTREQTVLLLHKSAVIFETLKNRYMQMNCKDKFCKSVLSVVVGPAGPTTTNSIATTTLQR
jgi:hypothetical protein